MKRGDGKSVVQPTYEDWREATCVRQDRYLTRYLCLTAVETLIEGSGGFVSLDIAEKIERALNGIYQAQRRLYRRWPGRRAFEAELDEEG